MWILGISPSHDASAALLHDGTVIAAIAEERLTRIKGDGGRLPRHAIEHVLRIAGA
jgi:carbamoyltransferase